MALSNVPCIKMPLQSVPCRERPLRISVKVKKTLFFSSFFSFLSYQLEITRRIFHHLSHFLGMLCNLHRQENANRRILNQITHYDSVALVRCQWHYIGLLLKVENPIRLWLSMELKAHRLQNDSFKFFDQSELSPNSSETEDKLRRSEPKRGRQEVIFILG